MGTLSINTHCVLYIYTGYTYRQVHTQYIHWAYIHIGKYTLGIHIGKYTLGIHIGKYTLGIHMGKLQPNMWRPGIGSLHSNIYTSIRGPLFLRNIYRGMEVGRERAIP